MRQRIALAALLLLAGCAAAPPMIYLRLAPVQGGPVKAAAAGPIAVAPVEMPPAIDRVALTSQTGESTLGVAANASWAAPLGGMTTEVLAQDLASRIRGAAVLMPGETLPSSGAREVRVDVVRFLPVTVGASAGSGADHVALDAGWQVISPHGAVLRTGFSRIAVPSEPGAEEAATAMSVALGRLADRIAASFGGA
jgi:uncharacterized lipoprotein YmbA